jgi:hypothetical protein
MRVFGESSDATKRRSRVTLPRPVSGRLSISRKCSFVQRRNVAAFSALGVWRRGWTRRRPGLRGDAEAIVGLVEWWIGWRSAGVNVEERLDHDKC